MSNTPKLTGEAVNLPENYNRCTPIFPKQLKDIEMLVYVCIYLLNKSEKPKTPHNAGVWPWTWQAVKSFYH